MEEFAQGQLVDDRNVGGHSWQKRRRLMFAVVGFSMGCIAWALYKDSGSAIHLTAVQMGFTTLISITGTYVFGAIWNDKP